MITLLNNGMRSQLAKSFDSYLPIACDLFELEVVEKSEEHEDYDSFTIRISPDIPSEPLIDIHQHEDLEIQFNLESLREPKIRIRRSDFPSIAHVNPQFDPTDPKSICLYETPWYERRLKWNNFEFISRIFDWFKSAADGSIHKEDQPIENLFISSNEQWILPKEVQSALTEEGEIRTVYATRHQTGKNTGLWGPALKHSENAKEIMLLGIEAEPRPHGQLHMYPENLYGLLDFLGEKKDSFLEKITATISGKSQRENRPFFLLVKFRLLREIGDEPERDEYWLFGFPEENLYEVGLKLGICDSFDGYDLPIIGQKELPSVQKCKDIELFPIKVYSELTREQARAYSGIEPTTREILLIGTGTLGSQLHNNLERCAWGKWTIADNDHLLPHNLVRHTGDKSEVGWNKATISRCFANRLYGDEETKSIEVNVLSPSSKKEKIDSAYQNADLVLDCSASTAVSRHLARTDSIKGKVVCAFITANLNSLVVLAESPDRSVRVDWLEMLLYREALKNESVSLSLNGDPTLIPYANSCRDKSVQLPLDTVSIFGGILSKTTRAISCNPDASIDIYSLGNEAQVSLVSVQPTVPQSAKIDEWTIVWDKNVESTMATARKEHLPNETGGVLIGSRDVLRNIIYIVDLLPPPPDSESTPTHFRRGIRLLKKQLESVWNSTGGGLEYVGEWHSHPEGVPALPSNQDIKALNDLKSDALKAGYPVVAAINGDDGSLTFILV